jgi:hypothetical protein
MEIDGMKAWITVGGKEASLFKIQPPKDDETKNCTAFISSEADKVDF